MPPRQRPPPPPPAPAGLRRVLLGCLPAPAAEIWDVAADSWSATDALGRRLPSAVEVGPPRADRTVAMFYFLWHGAHIVGGPHDISRILARHPGAMEQGTSPPWGPLRAPHHWGESIFGYYLSTDEFVLRKHAQMLSDAGVDLVVFDVTNQVEYRDEYRALLRVWGAWRELGNRTPQVAFLTPFWDPGSVVHRLWRDLYRPGMHPDLWFRWDGRPLILADPALLDARTEYAAQDTPAELLPGRSLGQRFVATNSLAGAGGRFPTWSTRRSGLTLTLRRDGPGGETVARQQYSNVIDNAWLMLHVEPAQPAGTYYLEATEPVGKIGWWSHSRDQQPGGRAFAGGVEATGDRTLRLAWDDPEARECRRFFTFRKPQPDYFAGASGPDMWSWLEVFPQHVFHNARGEAEQVSVGVAQNAAGRRLGAMSEKGARGRSWHNGARDLRPDAVRHGLNFAEQAGRALSTDPRVVFVTGWNEWIAGRFTEFGPVHAPVVFVDQFDQEHSRDIEPMRGGHGDDYYYQLVAFIRRYKGARPPAPVDSSTISVDGRFEDWAGVAPEFRDTVGDPVRRRHRGWDSNVVYRADSGRNDLVAARISFDGTTLHALVRTREPVTPPTGDRWMLLFLDTDGVATNGWLGFDHVVNLDAPGRLQRHVGPGFRWAVVEGTVDWRVAGTGLELAVPWRRLGLTGAPPALEFKWADNPGEAGDWTDFTLSGDAAPNDRFRFRAEFSR